MDGVAKGGDVKRIPFKLESEKKLKIFVAHKQTCAVNLVKMRILLFILS